MEEEQYVAYRKFISAEEAEPIAELFKLHNIKYLLEDYKAILGYPYVFSNKDEVEIKILPEQFEMADKLLEDEAKEAIHDLPADHYLFTFTYEELWEVLEKPFDWPEEDYLLAQQLLKQRGETVSQSVLDNLRTEYLEELKKPESISTLLTIVGFASASFGGILGIFIGLIILSGKKTIPTGEKVYAYDNESRQKGRLMILVGSIVAIIALIYLCAQYSSRA